MEKGRSHKAGPALRDFAGAARPTSPWAASGVLLSYRPLPRTRLGRVADYVRRTISLGIRNRYRERVLCPGGETGLGRFVVRVIHHTRDSVRKAVAIMGAFIKPDLLVV